MYPMHSVLEEWRTLFELHISYTRCTEVFCNAKGFNFSKLSALYSLLHIVQYKPRITE